jgi:shikimate kinase
MAELRRTIALVGMMGAGKSSIGRRLAARLKVSFRDADDEIELAAGCTIAEIFARYGESAFRDCERKVIDRLLGEPPHVLATGGGAFIDPQTRARMKDCAVSVWIKAPLDLLLARVQRKDDRPLLKGGDPRTILEDLLEKREPIYAEADLTVESEAGPHDGTVERIMAALIERGVCEEE